MQDSYVSSSELAVVELWSKLAVGWRYRLDVERTVTVLRDSYL